LHNIREGIGRDFLEIEETTTHLYSGRAPAKQEIENSIIHIYIAVGKPAKHEIEETITLIYIAVGNPANE